MVPAFDRREPLGVFFALGEFLVSSSCPSSAKALRPSRSIIENIRYGVSAILDPWRHRHPTPLIINSGYRDEALNAAIGGSPGSDHIRGCAVDLDIPSTIDPLGFFLSFSELGFPWRELRLYPKRRYLHLSWNAPGKPWERRPAIILEGGNFK